MVSWSTQSNRKTGTMYFNVNVRQLERFTSIYLRRGVRHLQEKSY